MGLAVYAKNSTASRVQVRTQAQRGDVAAEATRPGSGETRPLDCQPATEQEAPGTGAVQGRKGNYALRTATCTLLKTHL